MIQVSIINRSALADSAVSSVVGALQVQCDRDFQPAYKFSCKLDFVGKTQTPDPTHYQQLIMDHSDQPGALGYHDYTSAGMPIGKVFQATDAQYNEKWTATLSHELIEQLVDPTIDLCVFEQVGSKVRFYAVEACDAVEADEYDIQGVTVSNFVHSTFWERFRPAGTTMDHLGLIKRPLEIRPQGYLSYFSTQGGGWRQLNGSNVPVHKLHAPVGSRRHTRTVPFESRLFSIP